MDGGGSPVGGEVLAVNTSTGGQPINTSAMSIRATHKLEHSFDSASEHTGPGIPNYLGPAIISPSGSTAWVPSKQDNILRGLSRSTEPLNHQHSVRAITSVLDIASGIENLGDRVDHDNASVASNGVFDRYGTYLFVTLEGNRQVAVVDVFSNEELFRVDVGLAPAGYSNIQ